MSQEEEEEEPDLRELLMKRLEENGSLATLKAQLRATIFLALEEEDQIRGEHPLRNSKWEEFLKRADGRQLAALVHDFLKCLNLKATESVFLHETGLSSEELEVDQYFGGNFRDSSSEEVPALGALLSGSAAANPSALPNGNLVRNEPLLNSRDLRPGALDPAPASKLKSPSLPLPETAGSSSGSDRLPEGEHQQKTGGWMMTNGKPIGPLPSLNASSKPANNTGAGGSGSSLLGNLPSLSQKPGLPPLNLGHSKGKEKDFLKLLNDSLENLDSEQSSSGENTPKQEPGGKAGGPASKLAKQKSVDEQPPSGKRKDPASGAVFKRPSPRDADSSLSEEIVENLEVDDLLDSAKSEKQISF